MNDCLVIDDIEPTLARMSDLGRRVVAPGAQSIREAVLRFASARGWRVVAHGSFSRWTRQTLEEQQAKWATLDPLYSAAEHPGGVELRTTRRFQDFGSVFLGEPRGIELLSGESVMVVDDAASSGSTLLHVAQALSRRDARMSHVVVCASSAEARERLRRACKPVWLEFIPGDYRVIHLRDGCPYMPHGGRGTRRVAEGGDGPLGVEVRLGPRDAVGSLWQVMWIDRAIKGCIQEARQNAARALERELGRPARIYDLRLLGNAIPAMAPSNRTIEMTTALDELADC
jgi:hypothetical protein